MQRNGFKLFSPADQRIWTEAPGPTGIGKKVWAKNLIFEGLKQLTYLEIMQICRFFIFQILS